MWIGLCLALFTFQKSFCMSLFDQQSYLKNSNAPELAEDFLAEDIISKGYLPSERSLSKPGLVMNMGNDVTYLLSKLSDEDLIRLLNDQPKKHEYNFNDIIKVATESKTSIDKLSNSKIGYGFKAFTDLNTFKKPKKSQNSLKTVTESHFGTQIPYFRLENKPILSSSKDDDPSYKALQKLNGLLNGRAVSQNDEEDDSKKKEMLFDILVSQLKTLCCKTNKQIKGDKKEDITPQFLLSDFETPKTTTNPVETENMFLILNDEIKSNGSDEVILVDPESLDKNSTVLLLGPITTPLSDRQLKKAMSRISNELSKPDYLPLLQQLADGTITDNNIKLVKSLVSGPETRRYIKPHRCNHQSKLARVYNGPKWLICTGYLNVNRPSIYDR